MFTLIIFSVGAFIVFGTILQKERRKRDLKYASITSGKVIGFKTEEAGYMTNSSPKSTVYLAEISFTTEQNEEFIFV